LGTRSRTVNKRGEDICNAHEGGRRKKDQGVEGGKNKNRLGIQLSHGK